jgi:hypothetical protein
MAFTEDLGAFFTDFAETVTVAGTVGAAIFDDGFASALDGAVASSGPQLVVRLATFPAAAPGAAVFARGVNYAVAAVEPDGTGLAVLRLERY